MKKISMRHSSHFKEQQIRNLNHKDYTFIKILQKVYFYLLNDKVIRELKCFQVCLFKFNSFELIEFLLLEQILITCEQLQNFLMRSHLSIDHMDIYLMVIISQVIKICQRLKQLTSLILHQNIILYYQKLSLCKNKENINEGSICVSRISDYVIRTKIHI